MTTKASSIRARIPSVRLTRANVDANVPVKADAVEVPVSGLVAYARERSFTRIRPDPSKALRPRRLRDLRASQAILKALQLICSGKSGLLMAIPLYRLWWRLRGLDFGFVPFRESGLDAERAKYHKDGGGPLLFDLLKQLNISENDAVLDLGSGKGGAMATLARFPFRQVNGVEISPEFVAAAHKNLAKLKIRKYRVYLADASTFTELDDYTHIFMYNPFPAVVLTQVLANLEASLRRKPRTVRLLYSNPVHEQVILATCTFMKAFVYEPYPDYRISVYES